MDKNSGDGSTGKPCVIWPVSSVTTSRGTDGSLTYVHVEVFDWESGFGGHLDLDTVLVLKTGRHSQLRSLRKKAGDRELTCRTLLGYIPLLLASEP